jgi:hypothetical protein
LKEFVNNMRPLPQAGAVLCVRSGHSSGDSQNLFLLLPVLGSRFDGSLLLFRTIAIFHRAKFAIANGWVIRQHNLAWLLGTALETNFSAGQLRCCFFDHGAAISYQVTGGGGDVGHRLL